MRTSRKSATCIRKIVRCTALALLAAGAMHRDTLANSSQKEKKIITTKPEASAGSNAAQAIMAAQAPLAAAAERIQDLDPKGVALGGIELDVEKHTLNLWWKGDPPAAVRKEIEHGQRVGIRINLRPALYSQRELIDVARSVIVNTKEYPGIVSVGPLADGSGLEVGVTDVERAAAFKFPVPVHVVARKDLAPLFTRGNDVPPWWAGAVTRAASTGATCSTGFAMMQGSTKGILTTEHCACGGNVVFNNGVGVPIGPAEAGSSQNPSTDSLFIIANSGPAIYDGGVGVGEFSKPVVGRQSPFRGLFVCTSGAATGVHCNIKIDITKLFFSSVCFPGRSIQGGVIATEVSGGVAAGAGDSGGPVFTLAQDPSTVNAAGIIFVGINQTPCQSFGTTCFNSVAFTDIDSIRAAHSAEVLVPQASGGVTFVSLSVFCGALLFWVLIQIRLRKHMTARGWTLIP